MMKVFFVALILVLLGLSTARVTENAVSKCEDVLPAKICVALRKTAEDLKQKVEAIDQIVVKAVKEHLKDAEAIIQRVRQQLAEMAKNLKCEAVLPITVCDKLKAAAGKLKQVAGVVDKLVREAVQKGITEAKEVVKDVQQRLVELAKNFKCEDALSEKICAKLREIAVKVEVKVSEVEKRIKQLIAKGIVQAKKIIEKIREKLFPTYEDEEFIDLTIKKCEDVLSSEMCAKLRAAAEKLKQKAKVVDEIVRRVVKEKITEAKEIVKRVQQKLVDLAKNFKCEDVLSEKICAKIREVAVKVEVKIADIEKQIKELVAKGIVEAKKIIEKIREKLFPAYELEDEELISISKCEDVLPEEMCTKLRAAAEKLKQEAKVIDELVRRVVGEKIVQAKEIVKRVREKLVEMAKDFKCEDVLTEEVCAKIRKVAAQAKAKIIVVEDEIKKVVAQGVTEAKKIAEKVKQRILDIMKMELKCEDVISAEMCTKLRAAAKALKQKAKVVDEIVRKLVKEKITEAKEIIKRVRQKLVDLAKNFKCENVLPAKICAKMREVAAKVEVKVAAIEKVIKELVAKGIVEAKKIIEKIREKLFPAYEEEEFIDLGIKKCEDVLTAELCTKLRAAAEKLKQKAIVVDEIIRRVLKEKITEAKEIVKRVQQKLVDLAKNVKCENILSEEICAKLRATAEKLKQKAKVVDELVRRVVAEKVAEAKEIVAHVRERIVDLAKNFKCEDVLPEKVCGKISEIASQVRVKAAEITQVLKEIIAKGITDAKAIIEKIREHFFPLFEYGEYQLL